MLTDWLLLSDLVLLLLPAPTSSSPHSRTSPDADAEDFKSLSLLGDLVIVCPLEQRDLLLGRATATALSLPSSIDWPSSFSKPMMLRLPLPTLIDREFAAITLATADPSFRRETERRCGLSYTIIHIR